MNISETGLDLIKHFEGFSDTSYPCAAGHLTIGYGHRICAGETFEQLTRAQARALLEKDVCLSVGAVRRLVTQPISQAQFDALCSFTFNVGSAALQRSTLRRKLNRGEIEDAAEEFSRWVRAGGRIVPGLVMRRQHEQALFLT